MSESGAGLLIAVVVATLWYGEHEHNRAEELQGQLTTAQSQIEDLKTKAAALEQASDNLKQQMERFDSEDWSEVVPDAKDAADEVDSAKDDLQASTDDSEAGE